MKAKERVCRKIIFSGIIGLLVFTPLPAASVSEGMVLVIQLSVVTMMAVYLLMEKPKENELLSGNLKIPGYFFAGFWAFVLVQLLPLPKFLVRVLSPAAYAFRENHAPHFAESTFVSLSLIPAHTLREGLSLLPYFLFAFLIIKTVNRSSQIIRIYGVLLGMGVFEAFYGLYQLYSPHPRILFYEKLYGLDVVTGTFVNRNHFAGYLEMIIPLGIGLLLARTNILFPAKRNRRESLLRLSEKTFVINLLVAFGILVMAVAVIFSKSRTGVIILFLSLVLFFLLAAVHWRKSLPQKAGIFRFLVLLCVALVVFVAYVGIEASFERFSPDKLLHEDRPTFWSTTIRIFSNHPLFGTGLGTFASIYPHFMEGGKLVKLSHAHNDFLEYMTELGILGSFCLFGGVFLLLAGAFRVWKQRTFPVAKGMAMGGLVALFSILVHSIVDFNLQIPANRLLFSAVLGLTLVSVSLRPRRTGNRDGASISGKPEKIEGARHAS